MSTWTKELVGQATSLDPHETTEPQQEAPQRGGMKNDDVLDVAFRHSGWTRNRGCVLQALVALEAPADRIDRFRACGSDAWVQRSDLDSGNLRIVAAYCRDRFCLPCATNHGQHITDRVRSWLASQPARFVTLTLASDGLPLADRLNRLYRAFKRLRRGVWWRSRVPGGCATVEVKWSVKSEHWHPHLHILCRGTYLDQAALSREWHVATGDSYIVDVRLANDTESAAAYVAKYVAKPANNTTYNNHDRLCELMSALKGRRLLLTFGDCKLPEQPPPEEKHGWTTIGRLSDILWRAQQGVLEDLAIVAQLTKEQPCQPTNNHSPPSDR